MMSDKILCVYIKVSRGLILGNSNHIQTTYVEGDNNNSYTFSSLLSLVEYNFTVSISAGPFGQQAAVDGRLSSSVSFITPATCKPLH